MNVFAIQGISFQSMERVESRRPLFVGRQIPGVAVGLMVSEQGLYRSIHAQKSLRHLRLLGTKHAAQMEPMLSFMKLVTIQISRALIRKPFMIRHLVTVFAQAT